MPGPPGMLGKGFLVDERIAAQYPTFHLRLDHLSRTAQPSGIPLTYVGVEGATAANDQHARRRDQHAMVTLE